MANAIKDKTQALNQDYLALGESIQRKQRKLAKRPTSLRFNIEGTGVSYDAALDPAIVLGRDASTDIVSVGFTDLGSDAQSVSRTHCLIEFNDGALMVQDLNSTNGTRLNGETLKPNVGYALQDGDKLQLGKVEVRIDFIY